LKAIPAQQKKLMPVLRHLVKSFEPGMHYAEDQVNQILGRFHEDTATLRRMLVTQGLLVRQGGEYWRI
jgi:hypothetical protein